jgi:hypothetical protein
MEALLHAFLTWYTVEVSSYLQAPPILEVLWRDTELAVLFNLAGDYKVQNLKEMQINVWKETVAN